jgi:chemotaxis family two-component system sensor kinase Cph1
MNNFNVDLTNCDKEPIHIPGKIQSQGFLIAVNFSTNQISFVSENVSQYLSVGSTELLELPISELSAKIGVIGQSVDFGQLLNLGQSQNGFEIINPYKLQVDGQAFYLIIHRSDTNFILEFEPVDVTYDVQSLVAKSISGILLEKSLTGMLDNAAKEVKKIIGYDRIMVYRFSEDGHGEVISEVKNEELAPFLGLHYPASDIPQQARALYKLNLTRIIADVNSSDSLIATYTNEQLDLTHSGLRAVSPIHIQYLKNMGVESSFSISLISKGELWGLIACHNYSPKFIDYRAREGTKLIGQIISSALEYRQTEEDNDKSAHMMDALHKVSEYLERDSDMINAMIGHDSTILNIVEASGVAISFEGSIHKMGITPGDIDLKELFEWLKGHMKDSIYHTFNLSSVFSPAKRYTDIGSGILTCMLSKEMGELIVYFKPEKLSSVNWAGNPEKPVEVREDGLNIISPRKSFESWTEIVRNTSEKWAEFEITNVLKIRERIITIISKKASEIRQLNERLKLAYEELDTFSYTISHDLRTPLTSIKSYTELFLAQNKSIDDKGKRLLDRVVTGADKMSFLINEILKLARVGRLDVVHTNIDMSVLLKDIALEVISSLNAAHVNIQIGDTPEVKGDHTLISQIFSNLIGNAVKYSAKSENPAVSIQGEYENDEIVYSIKDNGIGIDVNYHDKVFELFKRMENVKDFEGTGVGLAIVKRIIEKHNGRIWFESELNVGTTFFVAFKNR